MTPLQEWANANQPGTAMVQWDGCPNPQQIALDFLEENARQKNWCRRQDLNLHADCSALAPQASVSANSTTPALGKLLRGSILAAS